MALTFSQKSLCIKLAGDLFTAFDWASTKEGREYWAQVSCKLTSMAMEPSEDSDPSEYAEALNLLWSERIGYASHHTANGCKRFEDHFTEAENVFRHTEDGDYIEELVDVVLPWEVD